MAKKVEHIGTITSLDLLRAPKGHAPTISGTGPHRNRKQDKKLRRQDDKREAKSN